MILNTLLSRLFAERKIDDYVRSAYYKIRTMAPRHKSNVWPFPLEGGIVSTEQD